MEPIEKAKQLVQKFLCIDGDNGLAKNDAVKCAILLVDEVIEANPHSKDYSNGDIVANATAYWEDVRREIEALQ